MIAYKRWLDENHYIHKDTINDLDVCWTTDIKEAKVILPDYKGWKFFFDKLGFSLNPSKYDSLKISKNEKR